MSKTPKLSVKRLYKTYRTENGDTLVLDGISFDVHEGEFLSILGPSGCGKTTLLKIIAGLLEADSGEVLIDGEEVGLGHSRVGYVFQQESLFPWRTVRQNIEFGLEIRGVPPEERRRLSDRMIDLIKMRGLEDHLPHEISGGQARKTEMARSLITEPDILVSDEGLSNLDAQTRNYLQEEFLRIWQETGSTVIFVSHNVDEAVFMSDRILILSNVPARIIGEYVVDLPRPRVRASTGCLQYRAKILDVLRVEQEKALARQGP
ncbi:MAG: nitrate ABC transporter ATP-binding protein [Candidatus Thorarchaeota archaeon]|nr:MAG: nitrate ABC transporter ATP-binding protein [Candidatus Thorarchaeota archaeon]